MRPNLLFLITSDPRVNHRVAEAVRIAAGVAVWKTARVTLCLRGPAAMALDENAEELVDGGGLARHLALLRDSGGRVLTSQGDNAGDELARLAASQSTVLHF